MKCTSNIDKTIHINFDRFKNFVLILDTRADPYVNNHLFNDGYYANNTITVSFKHHFYK